MTKEDRNKSFLLDAFNDYILEPSDDNLDLLNQMAKKYRNVWIQSSSNKREKENLEIANKLVFTKVDCEIEGDVYYPDVNLDEWVEKSSRYFSKNPENDYDFVVKEYERY